MNTQIEEYLHQAIREMKRTMRQNGDQAKPLFRCFYRGRTKPKDFTMPTGTEIILNHGVLKEILFDYLRQYTRLNSDVEAWIMGTDAWYARPTEEGSKHSPDEHQQHQDTGFQKLQQMGWVIVENALVLSAQTEADVILAQQVYTRTPEFRWLGLDLRRMKQSEFGGRQKMWGATGDDITGGDRDRDSTSGPVGIGLLTQDEIEQWKTSKS